jgi:hypothetical protein
MLKKIQDYLNTKILLMRLEVSERVAKTLAILFRSIILLMLFGIFFIFASIAASLYIGEFYGSMAIGFLAVSAVYLLLALILWIFNKPLLEHPFMNQIIKVLFEIKDDEKGKDAN